MNAPSTEPRLVAVYLPGSQCWRVFYGCTLETSSMIAVGGERSWRRECELRATLDSLGLAMGEDRVIRTARGDA